MQNWTEIYLKSEEKSESMKPPNQNQKQNQNQNQYQRPQQILIPAWMTRREVYIGRIAKINLS